MLVTTQAFKGRLKSSNNMNLSSDDSVLCLTHEGITNFTSLSDFDKKRIKNLPGVYKNRIPVIEADAINRIASETFVFGASVSSTLVISPFIAVNSAKYYGSISRVMNPQNIASTSVLAKIKIEYEAYLSVKDEDHSKVSKFNDRDNDRKIIR